MVFLHCSAVLSFGAHLGEFHYNPPADFAGLSEAVEPGRVVELQQFLPLGDPTNLLVSGPSTQEDHQGFVPAPIDTSKVPTLRQACSPPRGFHI